MSIKKDISKKLAIVTLIGSMATCPVLANTNTNLAPLTAEGSVEFIAETKHTMDDLIPGAALEKDVYPKEINNILVMKDMNELKLYTEENSLEIVATELPTKEVDGYSVAEIHFDTASAEPVYLLLYETPRIIKDKTYLPVRDLVNILGEEVTWDNARKAAIFNFRGDEIAVAEAGVFVNGKLKLANYEREIINDRMFIRMTDLTEIMGLTVAGSTKAKIRAEIVWDNDTKSIIIYNIDVKTNSKK